VKILLHTCCAPCSIYPLEQMRSSGHEVTGYFYNHNIHPYLEYQKRKETLRQFSEQVTLPMLYRDDYDLEDFLAAVADKPAQRCSYCYASRLNATAAVAAESGFEAFSTSLLYSRYQRHDEIRELGDQLARQYGIEFYYEDFRKGWQEGIRISKEMGLYRQQYCGCIYSEKDRYHRKAKS